MLTMTSARLQAIGLRALALAAVSILAGLALPPLAAAGGGDRGAQILRAVDSGSRGCDQLTISDFEAVGEYVMGRMVGPPQAHESMDSMMRSMMGESAEQRMHALMGRRFTGCGGDSVPGQFGGMMGMMGAMGMMGGGGHGFGPMGSFGQEGGMGQGAPMGGTRTTDGDGDHDMPAGMWIVMLLVPILLVVIVVMGLWSMRPGQGRGDQAPLEILRHRYASGEIDSEEYSRRRSLLEGSR